MENNLTKVCRSCGAEGHDNFCSKCGLPYHVKRISMWGLVHDIFHLFTHLDKGFGYTLKRLLISPGHMQREYIEGDRSRHQKPFSMFLICASLAAFCRYWILQVLIKYYHVGNVAEATFFHEYTFIFFSLFLPIHVLIIYFLFLKAGYNYAEIGVFSLYSFAFFLVVATVISMFKFIFPTMDTAYVEFPFLLIYNTISFINFFNKQRKWVVALKSILILTAVFFLIQILEDYLIGLM